MKLALLLSFAAVAAARPSFPLSYRNFEDTQDLTIPPGHSIQTITQVSSRKPLSFAKQDPHRNVISEVCGSKTYRLEYDDAGHGFDVFLGGFNLARHADNKTEGTKLLKSSVLGSACVVEIPIAAKPGHRAYIGKLSAKYHVALHDQDKADYTLSGTFGPGQSINIAKTFVGPLNSDEKKKKSTLLTTMHNFASEKRLHSQCGESTTLSLFISSSLQVKDWHARKDSRFELAAIEGILDQTPCSVDKSHPGSPPPSSTVPGSSIYQGIYPPALSHTSPISSPPWSRPQPPPPPPPYWARPPPPPPYAWPNRPPSTTVVLKGGPTFAPIIDNSQTSIINSNSGNIDNSQTAIIGSGNGNTANSQTSIIGSGNDNSDNSETTTIDSDNDNINDSQSTTIESGNGNTDNSQSSIISSDNENIDNSQSSTISTDNSNVDSSQSSTISTDNSNSDSSQSSTIENDNSEVDNSQSASISTDNSSFDSSQSSTIATDNSDVDNSSNGGSSSADDDSFGSSDSSGSNSDTSSGSNEDSESSSDSDRRKKGKKTW
jgi:hypothetical protein